MSKKIFTDKEIQRLSNNPYVRSVSSKAITYTDAFKQLFISRGSRRVKKIRFMERRQKG
ncbi:hypothetical protein [Paenibacillus odorifer]|uniref:hypothetical protein n=1 Tax=Paenibacillus odorifer TaxID=189426 RepID=UPI00268E61AE